MKKQDQRRAAAEMIRNYRSPCILCGGPQFWTGAFIPNAEASRQMDVPVNRQRVTVYSLCADCKQIPEGMLGGMLDALMVRPRPAMYDFGTGRPIKLSETN